MTHKSSSHHTKNALRPKHTTTKVVPYPIMLGLIAITTFIVAFMLLSRLLNVPSATMTRGHEIGELVTIDHLYSIAVTKATFDNSIAPILHLPDTQRVLVIDAQIKNLSSHRLNYLPAIHTFVRDDQGNSYSFTPGLTSNTMPAQLIAPQQTVSGRLAFVIPSTYTSLWFYIDAKFDGQGPISYRIVP